MTPSRTLVAIAGAVLLLGGCTGSPDQKPPGDTPEKVLAHAKAELDETSGVELTLASAGLPESGGFVLVGGHGTALHPASFKGALKIRALGVLGEAEVVAIDGTVWVKSALLGSGFQKVDPATFGVPDPGRLLAADGGISDLLTDTEGVKEGESVRGGTDNDEVFTEYTGSLTARQVQLIVPTAAGDSYRVRYEIAADGRLHSAELTGEFYAGEPDVTYTVDLEKYDVTTTVTAP